MSARIADLQRSFERSLRAAERAPRTVVLYSQSVDSFRRWLADQGRPDTLAELTRPAVREWLNTLKDRGQAPNTRLTRYRGLYRFCAWLEAEGEIRANPMAKMEQPKVTDDAPVPVVSDDDLRRLFATCAGSRAFNDRRDLALFRVLMDTGVRVGELVSMRHDTDDTGTRWLDLDAHAALVSGKTGRRWVYFADKTAEALDRYLRSRAAHKRAALPALWLSERGALSADGVRERFDVRTDQAGIPHIHPHQLRHTWAHDFLSNGGAEHDAMRLAGWRSTAMLARYGRSRADQRAKEAALRLRRGDRL